MRGLILAGCLLAALAGCGSREVPWGSVSGTITRDGQPVEPAWVLFSNREAGVEIMTEADAEGRFTVRTDRIAGLPVGTYRVVITPKPVNPPQPVDGMVFTGPAPLPRASRISELEQDLATTRLVAVITEGENVLHLELFP